MPLVELASLSDGTILAGTSSLSPASGARASLFKTGTSEEAPVFSASEGTSLLPQPIVAGATGRLPGWVEEGARIDIEVTYKGQVQRSTMLIPVGSATEVAVSTIEQAISALTLGLGNIERLLAGGAPIATTLAATAPTPVSATLNGEVNPNGRETTYWFEWGQAGTFGSKSTPTTIVAGKANATVTAAITGALTAGTQFRLVTESSGGSTLGEPLALGSMRPTAAPTAATNVLTTGAELNGVVNPNGASTEVKLEYGTTTAYGKVFTATGSPFTGEASLPVTAKFTETLAAGTTYHFRVKAINTKGTTESTDATFSVSSTGALLLGDSTAAYTNGDQTSAGRAEAFQFTPTQSGTVEELQFRTNAAAATSKVVLGILADAGGKPDQTKIVTEGEKAGAVTAAEWVKVTGLSGAVVAGTPYWLMMLPVGATVKFNSAVASGGTLAFESLSGVTVTKASEVTGWSQDAQGGPVGFQALGKVTAASSETVVLKLNADKQTVEWKHASLETVYKIAISSLPQGSTGRVTGYVEQARGTDEQHFKPEAGVTYINSAGSSFTPKAGEVVYVGVQAITSGVGGAYSTEQPSTISAGGTEKEKEQVGGTAILGGVHLNWVGSGVGVTPYQLAAAAKAKLVRPGSGTALTECLKFAAANGLKVSFILPPSGTTFSIASTISTWEGLAAAEKAALFCIELGNENWGAQTGSGGGAGTFIEGQKYAEQFIAATKVQEEKSFPVPICLQTRMVPNNAPKWMEEQAKANLTSLKKALEPKGFLPQGNYLCAHPYFGLLTSEQENATSFTNFKDKAGLGTQSEWGGQRWMKEQFFWWQKLGIVVPLVITEYGAQPTAPNGVGSTAAIATTIRAMFEHCRKLEKGEYPTNVPSASYRPKLVGTVWYDQNSWVGSGQELYGIYLENTKPRTEGGIFEAFKTGAESL